MRIVVTGADGQLGSDLLLTLGAAHEVIGLSHAVCDVSQESCRRTLHASGADVVIHTAAYTDVDGCELDPERAMAVNAEGTRRVAEACRALSARLVYLSTDYIFDGRKGEPYVEEDPPAPLNVYGRTKLIGEEHVRRLVSAHWIVRTSWLFGQRGKNFVRAILGKALGGDALRVVDDQVGSPTGSRDMAEAIGLLFAMPFGTYHLTNAGSCSWFEFAGEVLRQAGLVDHVPLAPIRTSEAGRPAPRPAYSVLANEAWARLGQPLLRHWRSALAEIEPAILSDLSPPSLQATPISRDATGVILMDKAEMPDAPPKAG